MGDLTTYLPLDPSIDLGTYLLINLDVHISSPVLARLCCCRGRNRCEGFRELDIVDRRVQRVFIEDILSRAKGYPAQRSFSVVDQFICTIFPFSA